MKNNTKKFQIIKAAHKRFLRHGLAKTSVEEIARDLRIAKATIYHYFTSKEDIFYNVLASEVEKFITEISAIFDASEMEMPAKIASYLAVKEQLKEKYLLLYDLMVYVQKGNSLEKDELIIRDLLEKEINLATAILKKTINKKIDPAQAEFLVYQTWGLSFTTRFNEILNKSDSKKTKEFFIKTFEKTLI